MKKIETMYNMKETKKMKDFDDIIEFLEQPSSKVITYLKQHKNYIEKWFDEYLKEFPEINANLQYLDVTKSLQNCPTWISDFEELMIQICKNCKHHNEEMAGCSNLVEMKKCVSNYKDLVSNQCSNCDYNSEKCTKNILVRLEKIYKNKLPGFRFINYAIYSSRLSFTKYSSKIIDTNRKKETNSANTIEEIKDYSAGMMKKHKSGFPLLNCNFKFEDHFDKKCLTKLFNEITSRHINNDQDIPLRKIDCIALKIVSLYYLFFWDLLNKTFLRDCPSDYEIMSKTSNYNEEGMILANTLNDGKRSSEEIEDWANNIKNPNYDPRFKDVHSYLFQPMKINKDQFQRLLKSIDRLLMNINFSHPEKELPEEIRKKIDSLVKRKRMLRSPIKKQTGKSVTIDFNIIDGDRLNKYFNYKIHLNYFLLFYALFDTNFRNKKSKILTEDLINEIRKGYKNVKNLKEICDNFNANLSLEDIENNIKPVVYTSVSGEIKKKIVFHPDYKNNYKGLYDKPKDIIRKASLKNHQEWIKIIT